MKKRILAAIAPIAAAVLAVTAAQPASAAAIYTASSFAVTNASGAIAVDTNTGVLYVARNTSLDTLSIAAIDGTTHKVKTTTTLAVVDPVDSPFRPDAIRDIQVNSRTHTVWAAYNYSNVKYGGSSVVVAINGTTGTLLRSWTLAGLVTSVQVDQGSDFAYTATSSRYLGNDPVDPVLGNTSNLVSAGSVVTLNSTTGATTSTKVAAPATVPCNVGDLYGDVLPADIAFNTANYGLYVTSVGKVWAYSNKLKLAHTMTSPYAICDSTNIVANAAGSVNYLTDGAGLASIPTSTGEVRSLTTISGVSGEPVVDAGVSAIYRGTSVIGTSTLRKSGTTPVAVTAVNTVTHTLYSAGAGKVTVVKRQG